jgi:hypothetical protein
MITLKALEFLYTVISTPKMTNSTGDSSVPDGPHIAVEEQIQVLSSLVSCLPDSVPLATKDDEIARIFTKIPVPNDAELQWPVFNRRMDILFGEDVRNNAGRLTNVLRGPFGMDMVMEYLSKSVKNGSLLWEPVKPKLERLIKEMRHIM